MTSYLSTKNVIVTLVVVTLLSLVFTKVGSSSWAREQKQKVRKDGADLKKMIRTLLIYQAQAGIK